MGAALPPGALPLCCGSVWPAPPADSISEAKPEAGALRSGWSGVSPGSQRPLRAPRGEMVPGALLPDSPGLRRLPLAPALQTTVNLHADSTAFINTNGAINNTETR